MKKNNQNIPKSKPNPENSSVLQALLDIQAAGGNVPMVDSLIALLRKDGGALLETAEEIFNEHQYPQHVLTFCKLTKEYEFARFLSPKALSLLTAMCQNMWHGNLIQLSQRDVLKITSISSLTSVKPALKELTDCGCIAVAIKGNTRKATTYMVNPCISTLGKDVPCLEEIFWEYTGTDYENKPVVYSEPHQKWNKLTARRTYSTSRVSFKPDNCSTKLSYNSISEPEVKMVKRKKAAPADTGKPDENTTHEPEDGIDEKLPFADE